MDFANAGGSGTSPLLETIRFTSSVNDALTVGSLGLLLVAPPLGAVALATTGSISIGLGLGEAALTRDPLKAGLTLGEAALGYGAGRLALKLGGLETAKFSWGALRYRSEGSGRFITNAAGINAFQLGGAAENAASIPFMLLPDDNR